MEVPAPAVPQQGDGRVGRLAVGDPDAAPGGRGGAPTVSGRCSGTCELKQRRGAGVGRAAARAVNVCNHVGRQAASKGGQQLLEGVAYASSSRGLVAQPEPRQPIGGSGLGRAGTPSAGARSPIGLFRAVAVVVAGKQRPEGLLAAAGRRPHVVVSEVCLDGASGGGQGILVLLLLLRGGNPQNASGPPREREGNLYRS